MLRHSRHHSIRPLAAFALAYQAYRAQLEYFNHALSNDMTAYVRLVDLRRSHSLQGILNKVSLLPTEV